jgi:hypothetical protein
VCARKAGASVNGISRKQQRARACSGCAGVNGRARKHSFVRLDRAPKHQRVCAGWAGTRPVAQVTQVFKKNPSSAELPNTETSRELRLRCRTRRTTRAVSESRNFE